MRWRFFLTTGLVIGLMTFGCKKSDNNTPPPPPGNSQSSGENSGGDQSNPDPNSGNLKDRFSYPIGFGIDGNSFLRNETYKQIVAQNADMVTFGYEMKHGAIVTNTGDLDFSTADQMYDLAHSLDLDVYGHTLGWHQNQNAAYLNAVVNGSVSTGEGEVIAQWDFEDWDGEVPAGWAILNEDVGNFEKGSGSQNVHEGKASLRVNNTKDPSDNWRLQIISPVFSVVKDHDYKVFYWIKAEGAGGLNQVEARVGGEHYSGDKNSPGEWTRMSYTFKADATTSEAQIAFDMGASPKGMVTYVDEVEVQDLTSDDGEQADMSPEAVKQRVDEALKSWILGVAGHYQGKVVAWDVVNEFIADDGSGIRTKNNTNVPGGANDFFLWGDYLGQDFALKAFQYAEEADPDALLFINDYGLESNESKLNQLIQLIDHLKDKGAKIDGVGTQMHINVNTSKEGIDLAFQKLVATGLLVKVSELDISVNPGKSGNFEFTEELKQKQADLYKYVAQSYRANVKASQRYGITIWGVGDSDSWLVSGGVKDNPLLFDENYQKKPAFNAFLEAGN